MMRENRSSTHRSPRTMLKEKGGGEVVHRAHSQANHGWLDSTISNEHAFKGIKVIVVVELLLLH